MIDLTDEGDVPDEAPAPKRPRIEVYDDLEIVPAQARAARAHTTDLPAGEDMEVVTDNIQVRSFLSLIVRPLLRDCSWPVHGACGCHAVAVQTHRTEPLGHGDRVAGSR